MDLNKLSPAERIIAGSGVLFVLDSFLPWFRRCFGPICGSHSAWSSFLTVLAVLLAIVMVVQVVLAKLTTVALPELGNLTWGQVHLGAGAAAFVLVLLKFLIGDRPGGFVTLNRTIWLFLGLLLAAGLAYGGYLRNKEPETGPAVGPPL